MRTSRLVMVVAALSTIALAATAQAEDKVAKGAGSASGNVTTVTVHIALRAPRPQVATEVSKIAPARPLAELKQPLLDRVEKALDKAPF